MPRPSNYEFLDYHELPEDVWDEVADAYNMSNDMGRIVNPEYHPKLKTWLEANNGHKVKCYILWASW
jgi:hypothetical protein